MRIFGLFDKRIAGDDALLELARLRFRQAGLGVELHAGAIEQLEWLLKFRPSPESRVVVHLPRDFNLVESHTQDRICELASRFAGQVDGWVVHDHPDLVPYQQKYRSLVGLLDRCLNQIPSGPMLFIEYAAGLWPMLFAEFFTAIRGLSRISACIDTGHVGIWQARKTFHRRSFGEDICMLKSEPDRLPALMADIDRAVSAALPAVLRLIDVLAALGKPLHFHLHDGHPLSTVSPFGVSDHLSFLAEQPLPCEYEGRRFAKLLFGPEGLSRIVAKVLEAVGRERASLTLEIHPTFERRPLGDAEPLFHHWVDKTNAEQMNHWLWLIQQNHELLQAGLARSGLTSAAGQGLDRAPRMA